MALFVAPLLALIEPRFIPGPMLLAGVILAGTTAYRERGSVDARGLGVLIAVALSVLGLRIEASFLSLVLGGGAAGVMGTMVGIHGPPIALVFQHARPDI